MRSTRSALLLAAALSACSSAQRGPSGDAVILEVPFQAQQAPRLCGLAALEMLTRYYGVPLDDAQREALRSEAEKTKGLTGAALKGALEKTGYLVAVFPGTLDREATGLYRHLDARRPLIVMLGGHYGLVRGYDPIKQMVSLMDPAGGRRVVSSGDFDKSWASANRFTLLAVPAKGGENP